MEGGRWHPALAVALAGCWVASATACSGGERADDAAGARAGVTAADAAPPRGPSPAAWVRTRRPARAFAPLIHHHRAERSFPISARRFLERSTLKWKDARCIELVTIATGRVARSKTAPGVPRLRPARLAGRPPYRRRLLDAGCERRVGRAYATTEMTRPYRRPARPPTLPLDAGFYVDLLTDSYDGDPRFRRDGGRQRTLAGVPAYVERRPATIAGRPAARFSYWLLYAHNEAIGTGGERLAAHEGDWERVDVLAQRRPGTRRWRVRSLILHPARGRQRIPWGRLTAAASAPGAPPTHPALFSARSSHTLYASPGRRELRISAGDGLATVREQSQACADCAQWRTWTHLRRLAAQPWHGFGGGWGLAFQGDRTSGPLGP